MIYKRIIKPFFDRTVAFFGLLILSPILILVTLLLWISNDGRPFFIQTRPGKDGKPFRLIKFCSMTDEKDSNGILLSDEKRITPAGNLVRKTSLDEIPQLINVVKGEMSIVGPRPLLTEYLPLYTPEQSQRHNVLPGITGWAQVNGRNDLDWEDRLRMDVYYINNISFILDIKIIFITIFKVFRGEGVSSKNSATMEKFRGSSGE